MAMTLDDVTVELKEVNNDLDIISSNSFETNEYLLLTIDTFTFKINELITFFKGNSLKEIELQREQKEYQEDLLEAIENIELTQAQQDVKVVEGFLDSLARLKFIIGGIALALGAGAGIFASYFKNLKAIITGFKNLFKAISPKAIAGSLAKAFDSIGDALKVRLGAAGGAFGSAISSIVGFFTRVKDMFKVGIFKIPGVKGVVDTISRGMAAIGTMIKNSKAIIASISKVAGMLGSFKTVFGLVFKVVGRIFAPLYTLYETIMGIWKGYQDGGFIGAIKGGITGFFKGFIGDFLNIITGAAAWLAGALGFDKVEEALNSIDFNQIFGNLVDGIFDTVTESINFFMEQLGFDGEEFPSIREMVTGLVTMPFDLVRNAISKLASMLGAEEISKAISDFSFKDTLTSLQDKAKEFLKYALRSILPSPDSNAPWYDIGNIVSKAVPDSVYEFAGMDPETGEVVKPPKTNEIAGVAEVNSVTGKVTELPQVTQVENVNNELPSLTPDEFDALSPKEKEEYSRAIVAEKKRKTNKTPMLSAPNQRKAELLSGEMENATSEQSQIRQSSSSNNVVDASTKSNVVNNTTNNTVMTPAPSPVRTPNSPSEALWNTGGNFAQ